jgi:hypothetical protein
MLTSKAFWASAGERAIKTFAQTALALLGTSQVISAIQVDWAEVGGVSILAAILSLLTSVALPASETKQSVRMESEAREAAKAAPAKKATAPKKVAKK